MLRQAEHEPGSAQQLKRAAVVWAALALSACATIVPSPRGAGAPPPRVVTAPRSDRATAGTPATPGVPLPAPNAPATASNALTAGTQPGATLAAAPLDRDNARRALAAFRMSCPSVQRRTDTSGLTQTGDWAVPCGAARHWADDDAPRFFTEHFVPVQVGDGRGFATGYFEPEIAGSRTRRAGYETPIYGVPADLISVDLGQFSAALAGKSIRGRVEGDRFVPYYDRSAIDAGALAGRGLEIAWAADPVELFFLQVQGSGRLRLPDGTIMRIGYAGQNGRDYVGIGRTLRDAGALGAGETSMQGIMAYLRRQSDGGRAAMEQNPSWVFFRELTGAGAIGALGVPVSARASVAADPLYVPLGAPVLLAFDRAEASGLWIAQDTGGAIRGANRFDTFWGAGDDARSIAGGMSAHGSVLVLIPRASAARLTSR